jgi:signal transduction histidine kinase
VRLRAPGFRAQLVAAMVLTAAATLLVAGAAMLSPLEQRLRSDQLQALAAGTVAERAAFQALDAKEVRAPGTLERLVRLVGRRTGSHVVLLDQRLRAVANNDRDEGLSNAADVRAALRQGHTQRHVRQVAGSAVAEVAVPLRLAGDGDYVLSATRSLRDVNAAERVIRGGVIAGALAGLAAALVLGVWMSRRLVRRVRRLRDVALAVADGASGVEIPPDPHRDELASLTRALATMRTRLEQQEQARRTFVATASHELRTPLATLEMMLELLGEELDDARPELPAAREQVSDARAQVGRLSGLARDLLDLSRLDSDVALRAEPVELGELCRAVLAEFDATAREHGVQLRWHGPPDGCWALGDPGSVARIVRILVENGLRFAPLGTALDIAVACDGGQPSLDVADRGPGVPPEERERVFERFQRGSNTGGEGGFGLGLAIARELAQRIGGGLALVDGPPGARFRLSLRATE